MIPISPEQRTIAEQRARIGVLEEELRQANELLKPEAILPLEWQLEPAQNRLIIALLKAPGGFLSNDQLFKAVSRFSTESDPKAIVSQQVLRARRKLKHIGVTIECRWSRGYELPPESRAIIKAALEQRAAA